jgi:methylenetetrahydrofolate dehydrogenase (NADP+) / methenyltetrahydrofolate cyclohydrolase
MIIDGKKIAESLNVELAKKLDVKNLHLGVILVGDNPASVKYVERKKILGEKLGVEVSVFEYEKDITETELIEVVGDLVARDSIDGLIVQLPLPDHIDQNKILNLISREKDVDALSEDPKVLSPIVLAIKKILSVSKVDLVGKKILVVGNGKLVGRPIALWLASEGQDVTVVDESVGENLATLTKQADVLILGAGKAGLLKPNMIKEGVVIIDAATSESNGHLVGDADPACADKASLFTPVPGGVGPMTLSMLFQNLYDLNS